MTNDYFDEKRDLVLERVVDVPPNLVWKAWTEPEHLKVWFAPKPWTVPHAEVDLRPGGVFKTVMRSPDGEEFGEAGCILEVIPEKRLVWTDALGPGFRPNQEAFFTGILTISASGTGTRYRAVAMHGIEEAARKHSEMGFLDGWGTCLNQLVDHMKNV